MAAGIPEDVPPVAAHEAQAFQAFVIDGVTKQLQKDNKAERPAGIHPSGRRLRQGRPGCGFVPTHAGGSVRGAAVAQVTTVARAPREER